MRWHETMFSYLRTPGIDNVIKQLDINTDLNKYKQM